MSQTPTRCPCCGAKPEHAHDIDCALVAYLHQVQRNGTINVETRAPAQLSAAPDLLAAAEAHMRDRAATYDQPSGERSMGRTVQAFNIIAGRDLTESEGWLLMLLLKKVRDRQREKPHRDSLEDAIAYAALEAEARLAE